MADNRKTKRRPLRWIVGAAVVVLVLVVGGPFVYFHFIQGPAPAKLSLATTDIPSTAVDTTRAPLAGTWKISDSSVVRYRVKETLFGQSATATGQTNSVTGSMTITGTKLTAAKFVVDMTTVKSDRSQRDGQFQGRIMDTADFPTATFTLTSPIDLSPVPADGASKTFSAQGTLQLHGTTKNVTFTLDAERKGNTILIHGDEPITFSDYNIDNPSGGPASVGNSGELEFVLVVEPA